MDFIPRPPLGIVQLALRSDMKYGLLDPIQWPQVYAPGYEFLCAVRRPPPLTPSTRNPTPAEPSDMPYPSVIWWTPQQDLHFRVIEGSVFKSLGLLSATALLPLEFAVSRLVGDIQKYVREAGKDLRLLRFQMEMLAACDRLRSFPSTFQDARLQVLQVQRFWLMARAFLDYSSLVVRSVMTGHALALDQRAMGAFTADPSVVQQLFDAGLPVWFVRPNDLSVTGVTEVSFREPCLDQLAMKRLDDTTPPLYQGLAGPGHLDIVCRRAVTYLDVSATPILNTTATAGGPSMSSPDEWSRAKARESRKGPYQKPHASTIRGRDKFLEYDHRWMPPPLPAWKEAMESTDRSGLAKPSADLWGYWVPEPALLVGSLSNDRVERYIMNWLRLRPAWLYLLQTKCSGATRVSAQWWRDYLNGLDFASGQPSTRAGKRKEAVAKAFAGVLDMKDYQENQSTVAWFSHRLKHLHPPLCPLILWEVFETGFRYELLALDRVLVPGRRGRADIELEREQLLSAVFADYDLYAVRQLPSHPAGLAAPVPQARTRCLEALRQVELRWPLCPDIITSAPPLNISTSAVDIEIVERALARFYVHTFYAYSGRAPLVPHRFPS
ncbi:hypothetical protein OH77DRAFT_1413343 [Trametes cingulata]|nr:hypothetical protein OH77DRAFT_1413343 [Trametes cingulata]